MTTRASRADISAPPGRRESGGAWVTTVRKHTRLTLAAAVVALLATAFTGTARAAATAGEPVWGEGWVQQDSHPVLRPGAAADERLADAMAAGAPYHWTGRQAACLNALWMKVSLFDNFYIEGLSGDKGIAQLAGWVADPAPPGPSWERADGWFNARPDVQIGEGLVDIEIYWGSPCNEWAHDAPASDPPGAYPLEPVSPAHPGWRAQAGHLTFIAEGGRLALDPETFEFICGLPGLPAAKPAPACAGITPATTWPL